MLRLSSKASSNNLVDTTSKASSRSVDCPSLMKTTLAKYLKKVLGLNRDIKQILKRETVHKASTIVGVWGGSKYAVSTIVAKVLHSHSARTYAHTVTVQ